MKKSWLIGTGFFVCLCLLIIASFYDLQITSMLCDSSNFYARFFDIFGEFPLYALFPFSLCIMSVKLKRGDKLWHLIVSATCLVVSFCTACICFNRFFGALVPTYVIFLLSILVIFLIFVSLSKLKEETLNKLYKFAIFALVYCALILFINQFVKMIWGRYRYSTMLELGSFEYFSNWWEVQGFNGNRSFYSGHATSAMALLCLIPLARLFKLQKNKMVALHCVIFAFVVLVAISRLVYGVHFLSDVTMAVIVSGVIYLLLYKFLGKKLFDSI
ncbi:MAG: phosphatase PAP2 family protein [Clostridia bacterium]|nr:phosphatase PAP2 family protein [Clostridia bacterium]